VITARRGATIDGKGGYVALPKAYLRSAKHLPAILNAIQAAKAPPQFNQRFLKKSLEFRSPSDRRIIGVLKALKFINEDGAPTERYHAFLHHAQAPRILADGIRDAYADLFQADINAQDLTKTELFDKFRTLSQGQLSDLVINEMTMTFTELCTLADFQTPLPMKVETKKEDEGGPDGRIKDGQGQNLWEQVRVDGHVYRVQVVPPDSGDHAAYSEYGLASKRTLRVVLLIVALVVAALIGIFSIFGKITS
jgi:hypothetical protein